MIKKYSILFIFLFVSSTMPRAWWHELTFDASRQRYVTPEGVTITRQMLVGYVVSALNAGDVEEAQHWADMAIKAQAGLQDFQNQGMKYSLQETYPDQCVKIYFGNNTYYLC